MFTEVYGDMLQHTVSIASDGSDAWGAVDTAPEEIPDCMVLETTKRVAVGGAGNVQTSSCQVYHDLDGTEEKFALNTEITLPSGRKSKVIQVDVMRLSGFPSHVVAYLE
ncbi:hypothetical protein [Curtobacterium phage Parvaparticeps]|nr:hypothetical protein [Curtobacterium phage Parvaparticeps]